MDLKNYYRHTRILHSPPPSKWVIEIKSHYILGIIFIGQYGGAPPWGAHFWGVHRLPAAQGHSYDVIRNPCYARITL